MTSITVGNNNTDELLPTDDSDFSKKTFWNDFFVKRNEKAFEWYGQWSDIKSIVQGYCPAEKSNNVLVIGCGNSSTSEEMFDDGYGKICSIDFSEQVIDEMKKKTSRKKLRNGLKYEIMDMLHMTFNDETYNAVFDKGALDALMADASKKSSSDAMQMFEEIDRVLKDGGVYVCVTLAQQQIMGAVFRFFRENWMVHIHTFSPEDGSALCPFVFAIEKKVAVGNDSVNNVVTYFDGKAEQSNFGSAIKRIRKMQQMYNFLGGPIKPSDKLVLPLELWSQNATESPQNIEKNKNNNSINSKLVKKNAKPRYEVSIIDPPIKATNGICGVCIIPIGREHEWLFSSNEGQMDFARMSGYARFIIVRMNRDHEYQDMETIQSELSPYMQKLIPPSSGSSVQGKIPFLTISEDIGFRDTLYRGHSKMSGDYIVEEVNGDEPGLRNRRLVFFSNVGAIQSEARVSVKKVKGGSNNSSKNNSKGRRKIGSNKSSTQIVLDHDFLIFEYHAAMVYGLVFLPKQVQPNIKTVDGTNKCEICLIGTGGGLLAMFFHEHFKNVVIDTIDLDEEMLTIAKDWFGFKETPRLHGFVGDGIEFVNKKVVENKKYNVMIIDVDSKDLSEGLMFPPRPFMTKEFLNNVYAALEDDGILVVNLASRAQNVFEECISAFTDVFESVCLIPIEADVNKVIFCMKRKLIASAKDKDRIKAYKDKLDVSAQRITENAARGWNEMVDLNEWTSQLQFIS
eukprot:g1663.t1